MACQLLQIHSVALIDRTCSLPRLHTCLSSPRLFLGTEKRSRVLGELCGPKRQMRPFLLYQCRDTKKRHGGAFGEHQVATVSFASCLLSVGTPQGTKVFWTQ